MDVYFGRIPIPLLEVWGRKVGGVHVMQTPLKFGRSSPVRAETFATSCSVAYSVLELAGWSSISTNEL